MQHKFEKTEDFLKEPSFVEWVKKTQPSAFWENWLALNPEKEQEFEHARKIVLTINYQKRYELSENDTEDMLHSIQQFEMVQAQKRTSKKLLFAPVIRWSAAAILIFAILGIFYLNLNKTRSIETAELAFKNERTKRGDRKTIVLSDGSKVTINAQSTLSFPEHFEAGRREVYLNGEAFFEVVKNPESPFIVKTRKVETQVLGTSFNVNSYDDLSTASVAVVTGKVNVKNTKGSALILTPTEMGLIESEKSEIQKTSFDPDAVTGWKDGMLFFAKSDFNEVFRKIEIWYDVEIIVEGNNLPKGRYSGAFKNEKLEDVMQGIAFTSGFKFQIKGKQIIIHN